MFYNLRRKFKIRAFDHAIKGILDTPPLQLRDAPWTVVSMVATRDVPMYLLALKSFYRAVGRGKVVAIIDRDMPASAKDLLRQHVKGIEFVILEDIPTGECQRGGTWERILHIVDRTESEYTIQMDSDILTVADRLDEVVYCCEHNIPFTMADGFFDLQPMLEVARVADATPSDYIGIVTERAFARYRGAEKLKYVRGSSGFAGFCKGGVTRADLTVFHKELEPLVGHARFREWGTEQCASNFTVANSPNAIVLPYPEYASFGRDIPLDQVKLFHFIGANRFNNGYYAGRGRELIEKLRRNTPAASGAAAPLSVRGMAGNSLQPPVWIAAERVRLIADFGSETEQSLNHWLRAYPQANIIIHKNSSATHAPESATAGQDSGRVTIVSDAAEFAGAVKGRMVDILRIDTKNAGVDLLEKSKLSGVSVDAVVLRLDRDADLAPATDRLRHLGFRAQPPMQEKSAHFVWAFRDRFGQAFAASGLAAP